MIARTFFPLLSLAGAVLAEPIPVAAATTSLFAAASSGGAAASSFPTAFPSGAIPSINSASLSSLEASASSAEVQESSLLSILSGEPTLPASIISALSSAIPTSVAVSQIGCEIIGNLPDWYNSLPAYVKSALTSYENAISTWYVAHSTDFPSYTGTDTYTLSGPNPFAGCTAVTVSGGSGPVTTLPVNGGGATTTGGSSPKSTGTGTAAGGGAGGTGTSAGSAGASSTSKAGAAAPTGAVAVSFAGLVGVLGLMVAL